MREWSERHIRELVRKEYKRLGGGGLENKILDTLNKMTGVSSRKDYEIVSIGDYPNNKLEIVEIRATLTVDTSSFEIFRPRKLTEAERQLIKSSMIGIINEDDLEDIEEKDFIKVHCTGALKHNYLKPNTTLTSFYDVPIGFNLRRVEDNSTPCKIGFAHTDVLPIENIVSLDPPYMIHDKNNPDRSIELVTGFIDYGLSILWHGDTAYHDYSDGTFQFEYDTFIYNQLAYAVYKRISDLIGGW